jgi:hypothetical protein
MWSLLNDDGVISITAWMDYPFRNSLKITATLAEALDEAGIKTTFLISLPSVVGPQ